jgi:hypothetical protein
MKLIILALCTFIISAITFVYHSFSSSPSICLIPEGYTGDIYVVYDQPEGMEKQYEGNSRVYIIPPTGVLFTRFGSAYNQAGEQYYYVSPDGHRTKITQLSTGDFNEPWSYVRNAKEPSRNKAAIIDGGVIWSIISAKTSYDYEQAFAGSYNQFMSHKPFILSYIDSLRNICFQQASNNK